MMSPANNPEQELEQSDSSIMKNNDATTSTSEIDSEPHLPTTSTCSNNDTNSSNDEGEKSGGDDKGENNNGNASSCKCCSFFSYNGNPDAKGYSHVGGTRGAIVMSNQFLVSSMLYLASLEATCTPTPEEIAADATCTPKVYGFTPAGLITNIAVISGLLSAFCMPVLGAIIDFTPHRRLVGIIAAVLLTLIQAVQVYTVESTWFPMAILQAIMGFVFNIEVVSSFSYLPDISRVVGEATMTTFSSRFTLVQYANQFLFLVVIVGISWGLGTSYVVTAQISQGINAVWIAILFGCGWKLLTKRPANHVLEERHLLLTEGFRQNFKTAKSIYRHYKRGLRWFMFAAVFAGASTNSMATVAVVYLQSLGMDSRQFAIFYLVFLLAVLPATHLGAFITSRTNPNLSWKLAMGAVTITLAVGALALDGLPPENMYLAYIWGAFIGLSRGWNDPTQNLFFSMCLPKGQEAELAGFYVYCTQVLAWLPPLLFTVLVENNVAQKWGLILISFGFVIAICLLMFTAPWNDIVEEAMCGGNLIEHEGQVEEVDIESNGDDADADAHAS